MSNDTTRETQRDLIGWFRHAPFRMPRTRPELFRLLAHYNPHMSWDDFAGMIDFTGTTPSQIYQVVLGRRPDLASASELPASYDPGRHFREALISREFRAKFVATFLGAHAEIGRDIFIHIPKCAGTDLILNLGHRSVPVPKLLELEGWTTDGEFLHIAAGLARAAIHGPRLFTYGHMELGEYADTCGIRPGDRIFTVLRDPIDLMISQANYVVGRLRQDPTGREPDAAEYLRLLELHRLPHEMSCSDLKDLTVKALLNPLIAEPNRACFYLGRGSKAVYATAMENLIVHDVEVTTTKQYNRWLSAAWGVDKSEQHNKSEPILSNLEARRLCGVALASLIAEDQKLYDIVSWALRETGSASVTGQQLVRLLGPALTKNLSNNANPPLPPREELAGSSPNILVASDPEGLAMYLAPASAVVQGSASVEAVVSLEFGAGGGIQDYLREGWSNPEAEFTWTAADQAAILLPALPEEGSFFVRLIVSPFVVKGRLRSQRLELLANGILLGSCEVEDISLIEAEIPAAIISAGDRVTITLRLPTAARPIEISDSKDDRLLALAARSMSILRVSPPDGQPAR